MHPYVTQTSLMQFSNVINVVMFQSTKEAVFAVEFNPADSTNIITCGKSHVFFWTLSTGQFTKKQGIFGVRQAPVYSVTSS